LPSLPSLPSLPGSPVACQILAAGDITGDHQSRRGRGRPGTLHTRRMTVLRAVLRNASCTDTDERNADMYCPKCGTQNPDTATSCSSCGTALGARTQAAGAGAGDRVKAAS